MEKFFIINFSDGHTSPGLNSFEDVQAYIKQYATEAFWTTANKKRNPVISITRKQRTIKVAEAA